MKRLSLFALLILATNVMCCPKQGSSCKTCPQQSSCSASSCGEAGYVRLFNGENLDGWVGNPDEYGVEDGLLVTREGAHGSLFTEKDYSDFILKLEYRLSAGDNNGIGIRCEESATPPAVTGMEIQVLDDTFPEYQKFEDMQYNGSIYGAVPAERGHLKPLGQWNEMTIKALGSQITVWLNGAKILDVDMDTVGPKNIHNFDLVGLHNKTGRIAIAGHKDRVDFRNLRVKVLN